MPKIMTRNGTKGGTRKEPLARTHTATDFVWLGETADGFREEDLALIVDEDGNLQLVREDELEGRVPIARVRTPMHQADRIPVTEVICRGEGFEGILSSSDYFDAVFWTESAVEKFLYPYYHGQRLWGELMQRLKEAFEQDESAVAIAHRAPSTSQAVPSIYVGVITKGELTWMSIDTYLRTAARSPNSGSRTR